MVDAEGTLEELQTTEPIMGPEGIAVDPLTQDLLVHDDADGRVVRVNPESGEVSAIITGLVPMGWNFAALDISPDGTRMFLSEFNRIILRQKVIFFTPICRVKNLLTPNP